MTLPHGVKCVLNSCIEREDDHGYIVTRMLNNEAIQEHDETAKAVCELIEEGFIYPDIGWTVDYKPSFQPCPVLDYCKQVVPCPRLAWVNGKATNNDIMFGRCDRQFASPESIGAVSFNTNRYH